MSSIKCTGARSPEDNCSVPLARKEDLGELRFELWKIIIDKLPTSHDRVPVLTSCCEKGL